MVEVEGLELIGHKLLDSFVIAWEEVPRHIEIGVMFKMIVNIKRRKEKLKGVEVGSGSQQGIKLIS